MDELTPIELKHFTDKSYWHLYKEFYFNFFIPIKYEKLNI